MCINVLYVDVITKSSAFDFMWQKWIIAKFL